MTPVWTWINLWTYMMALEFLIVNNHGIADIRAMLEFFLGSGSFSLSFWAEDWNILWLGGVGKNMDFFKSTMLSKRSQIPKST